MLNVPLFYVSVQGSLHVSDASQIPIFGDAVPGIQYADRPGAYGLLQNSQNQLAIVQTNMGLFLPGGGLEKGEDEVSGLSREILEEIGHALIQADFLGKAIQFHWSEFYQCHFRKIGSFYRIQTQATGQASAADHSLVWLTKKEASMQLTQAFQRWAVTKWI